MVGSNGKSRRARWVLAWSCYCSNGCSGVPQTAIGQETNEPAGGHKWQDVSRHYKAWWHVWYLVYGTYIYTYFYFYKYFFTLFVWFSCALLHVLSVAENLMICVSVSCFGLRFMSKPLIFCCCLFVNGQFS